MASFVLSFFPLDILDEIWDLIESVSEGFLTYSWRETRWYKTAAFSNYAIFLTTFLYTYALTVCIQNVFLLHIRVRESVKPAYHQLSKYGETSLFQIQSFIQNKTKNQ